MAISPSSWLASAAQLGRQPSVTRLARQGVRGKVILVTGDSSGLGRATAERLSRSGAIVYGASRTLPPGAIGWRHLTMDIRDERSVAEGVGGVTAAEGRLDAVVHFAGVSLLGPVEDVPLADAQQHFDVNYFGAVRVLRAVLPVMRTQRQGRVVVIGSIAGLIGLPFLAHYAAAKAALDRLVEGLRAELRPFGVEVTIVHPGDYHTQITFKSIRPEAGGTASPYAGAFARAVDFFADNEARGGDPVRLARVIERTLAARRLPPRIVVGQPIERLGLIGRRLLPARFFERLMGQFYGP